MRHSGFTLVEVLLILLVVVFGLLGAVALVSYGVSLASKSQGSALGFAIAISVANDRHYGPTSANDYTLLDPVTAGDWKSGPISMSGSINDTTQGYINGFYIIRHETSELADIIVAGYARRCSVRVDVYNSQNGSVVATFATQIVRQKGTP